MDTLAIVFPGIVLSLIILEVLWSHRRRLGLYNLKESLCNVAIAAVNNLQKPLTLAWTYLVLSLFEPLQIFRLPDTGLVFLATFVVADFAYYWYHRLSHEVPVLWTMHHTHHSSPWMNFTTAARLNWIAKFVSPLFYAPLILLGFNPTFLAAAITLGLLYQFFLHTEAVGKLGWFEGKFLNTPSAHRVHHGSNAQYIDKNYAGVFVIWDRLFGSYEPECEKVHYGVTSGFISHNPLVVQFRPLWHYLRGEWRRERDVAHERDMLQQGKTVIERRA